MVAKFIFTLVEFSPRRMSRTQRWSLSLFLPLWSFHHKECQDRKECGIGILYCGGWIACETARTLANKLEIPMTQMGSVLSYLDIKIRKCSLGCFK